MDYDQQIQAALQRKNSAKTGFETPQGQMVGGRFIAPNALQYLAAGLRGVSGARDVEMANQELTDLQGKKQQAMQGDMSAMLAALRGTPERTMQPLTPNDDEGNVNPPVQMPAQPGSMDKFYQTAASSQFPQFQQMGMQGAISSAQEEAKRAQAMQEQKRVLGILQSAQSPQAAIAAGVPVDVVKNYYESPNFGKTKGIAVNGQIVDPMTGQPIGAPIPKQADLTSDLLVLDPVTGKLVPNEPLIGVRSRIASAGAAKNNVNVNMPDKKFYEGLGTAISGQIEKGFEQAQSAVQTLNNANQISQSLDKALIGPLANQRLTLAQIGQTLGVGGKDSTEILQNTRNVIQGLARQELSAAGQMKGQGQITESERSILRKAEAGQINEFTKPELETFIGAIRKTARSRIENHQRNLKNLGNDEQAQTILPYLQIQVPDDNGVQPAQSGNAMPKGFRVIP